MKISVLLVKPLYAGNIGSVARIMKNFGFSDLILISPKCKLGKKANDMAVHAKDILKKAKIYKNFETAIKNFDLVAGTTAEKTGKDDYFLRICITPQQLREKLERVKGNIAVVFGPEDIGLTNEELERCDIVVHIPTSSEYKSMNLSHSAAIVLYELGKMKENAEFRLASKREKDLIVGTFSQIANSIDYPRPAERRKIFNLMFTRILGRAQVTGREANTLIGVLKRIKKRLK